MADWSKPTLTSTYSNYLSETTGRDVDCATQFSVGTPTNIPTGAIRWNTSLFRWQVWSGTAWGELATTYALTGISCTSLNNTGNTTLGDSSADTVTSNAASWTFANATTITGSLTFSGSVAFNGNVTLGDAAGDTVTFVANTATVPAGGFTFSGGQVNFSSGLQVSGSAVLSAASTATLTNKTFDTAGTGNVLKVNGNTLSASAGTATITLPAATDTLVGRATTDTLTNKTITAMTADSSVSDTGTIAANSVGFRGLPISGGAPKTTNYQLGLTDAGKDVQMNATGLTLTIPSNSTAFPPGTTIVVSNLFAGNLTLAITTDSLFIAGTTTGGAGVSRTIAQNGQVTLIKKTSTMWWAVGAGLS